MQQQLGSARAVPGAAIQRFDSFVRPEELFRILWVRCGQVRREAASSWLLPLRIGHARAYAMFALGERMEAEAALACRLASAVVPQGELRKRAHDAAMTLTKRPAGAMSLSRKLMRDHQRIAAQIAEEGELFKERLRTPEVREAFAAFAERRPPDFAKVA